MVSHLVDRASEPTHVYRPRRAQQDNRRQAGVGVLLAHQLAAAKQRDTQVHDACSAVLVRRLDPARSIRIDGGRHNELAARAEPVRHAHPHEVPAILPELLVVELADCFSRSGLQRRERVRVHDPKRRRPSLEPWKRQGPLEGQTAHLLRGRLSVGETGHDDLAVLLALRAFVVHAEVELQRLQPRARECRVGP